MTWKQVLAVILLVVVLGAIFIISFVLYKKTPAPKGMENLKPDAGLCKGCQYREDCTIRVDVEEKKKECPEEEKKK